MGRRRNRTRWALTTSAVAISCAGLLLGTIAWSAASSSSSDPRTDAAETATPQPAEPQTTGNTGDAGRKVFAHYFPPYPLSIDNKDPRHDYYAENYLDPDGEGGKHASYGGLLRDRPLPRQPRSGDWRLADLRTEVEQAKDGGIDGFTVDVLSLTGSNWRTTLTLMKAADLEGDFVVIPNLDASSNITDEPVDTLADRLATLYSFASVYRTPEGAAVLSSFKAEAEPVSWWEDLIDGLESRIGTQVDLFSVLLDASEANMKAYAPISSALGAWGTRTPEGVEKAPDRAGIAHDLGVKWMAPIAVQDARPRDGVYAEAENTTLLRTMWDRALDEHADFVQLVTWNDYSESTPFAPSAAHGTAFLDLSRPYITAFTDGAPPHFTDDTVIVTYRSQRADARPRTPQNPMRPTLGGATTPPRDDVEVVTMLRHPAKITVSVGDSSHTFRAGAGLAVNTVPLEPGAVTVTAVRGEDVVADLAPPHPVEASPEVLDLQYYAGTSRTR